MTIEELLNDEEIAESIKNAESFEKMADILQNHGIEITSEDISAAFEAKKTGKLNENGELNENERKR